MISLADLHVRILLVGSHLSTNRRNVALRAVRRIQRHLGDPAATVPVETLLELVGRAWAATVAPDAGCEAEEQAAILAALALPPVHADVVARVRSGKATLADALAVLDLQPWPRATCVRLRGAVTRLLEIHAPGRDVDALPGREAALNAILRRYMPTDARIQADSWTNMCSRLRKLVRLVDLHGHIRLDVTELTGAWQHIIAAAGGGATAAGRDLWPLAAYCWWHDVAPASLSDAVIDALETDLAERGRAGPHQICQKVVYAWEKISPGLDLPQLARRLRRGPERWDLGFDELPAAFRSDWYRLVERFDTSDPLDLNALFADDDNEFSDILSDRQSSIARPIHRTTVAAWRTALTYAACAHPGRAQLTQLTEVLDADHLAGALRIERERRRKRRGGDVAVEPQRTTQRKSLAYNLIAIAERVGIDAAEIERMRRIAHRVDPRIRDAGPDARTGEYRVIWASMTSAMGERHRERLAAFNDPYKLAAWYEAPTALWQQATVGLRARPQREPTPSQVNDALVALLHLLLRCSPLRRENLGELRISGPTQNLHLVSGEDRGTIRLAAAETKNKQPLVIPLDAKAVRTLRDWCRWFRPVLTRRVGAECGNPYLFPASGMEHRALESLGEDFVARNRALGFVQNLHLARHLAAKLILDAPASELGGIDDRMRLVQIVLGHKSIDTTRTYYAELNQVLLHRTFQAALLASIGRRSSPRRRTA